MNIVVDTSIIISVITNEKSKQRIIKLTKGEELIAPSSLNWEIGNAFSAMFKRNRIELDLVKKALDYYLQIPIRLVDVSLINSLEIAKRHNIYCYDAYFLECAKTFKAPLMTLDTALTEIAKRMNIITKEV